MAEGEQTIEGPDGRRVVPPDERTWALVAHVGGLVTSFVVPLVVWLAKGDDGEFVRDQAREALNFQITVFLAYLVCTPLILVVIGFLFVIVIFVAHLVLGVVAAVRSYDGERYRYPVALRLVS